MKKIIYQLRATSLAILAGMFILTSCNKDLEQLAPIPTPVYPSGPGIAATLAANPNYSLYAALIARAGMTALLNDSTRTFTVFATDSNGMKLFANAASGGLIPYPSSNAVVLNFINTGLPVASAAGIVQYNTIGQKFPFASFGTSFPNYPITSQIILDANQPFVRMPIFPDGGTPFSYVNTLPVIGTDMAAGNGLIHTTFSVVTPPSATLKTMLASDATTKYFRAAVARADSGAVGLARLDSLLNYGVTNMTVLVPDSNAFKNLLIPMITGALIAQGVPPATAAAQANALVNNWDANGNPTVFSNPALYGALPASTVKGIIAYHFLASLTTSTTTPYQPNIRVFSNNVPAAGIFIKTLVNAGVAAHPGVRAVATYTGPAVTSLTFASLGSFPPGGAPFTYIANTLTRDRHAVNGVYHIIDKVLLPQ